MRISSGIETITLMTIKGSVVLVLQYALVALPIQYKDEWLEAADRLFGFDWLTFTNWANSTLGFSLLKFAYNSMTWQGFLVLILLCATDRVGRAWQMVTAAMSALLITMFFFAFFPADGTHAGCGLSPADVPARPGMCDYSLIIHQIKDEGLRLIDPSMATGLVAMPSFHAAAGALIVWASWDVKWLRVPVLTLNFLMMIATITVGAHYMVDVPAGMAIAALSIWVARKYSDYRSPQPTTSA